MNSSWRLLLLAGAVVAYSGFGSAPVFASPKSQQLVDQGVADLEAEKWRDALAKFLAASVADPGDHEAQFFQGVALNRLGSHEAALRQIERARAGNATNANMDFELGWALLGVGRFNESLAAFERYEASGKKLGKTRELMGRAHLALGDVAASDAAFDEAVARDASLAPSITFFRAGVAASRGEAFDAQVMLDSLATASGQGPVGRAVAGHLDMLRSVQAADRGKRWRLAGSFAVGHNSNVIGLADDQPLPSDISNKSAPFGRFAFLAAYDLVRGPAENLTTSYTLVADRYLDLSSQNSESHLLSADYTRQLAPRLIGGVRAFAGDGKSDGERVRRTVGARLSTIWQFGADISLEPSWTHAISRYRTEDGFAPADRRDGDTDTFAAALRFHVPFIEADAIAGVATSDTSTRGSNFDNRATGFSLGLSKTFGDDVTASVEASRTYYNYDNPDPRAVPSLSENRHDQTDLLTVNVSRPLSDMITAFGRVDLIDNESNIPVFQYSQRVWMIGATVTY